MYANEQPLTGKTAKQAVTILSTATLHKALHLI
jgi:hypothetical protein